MLKIIPLGGLGEIGLNMMAVTVDDYLLVIDAGLMFPEAHMPGVDLVIPNFQFLWENRDRVRALILTHGHEDHIGAVPFFLRDFSVPIYGTGFTLGLLKEKLREHDLPERPEFCPIESGQRSRLGPFEVEYVSVNHSIVNGVGLSIETPEGRIVHSGDFKIDHTPVDGQFTDLVRFAHFGRQGTLALLSDSTNAEKEGFTLSEREVKKTLEEIVRTCAGRVIVAVFASNISRIQQVIQLAIQFGRKVHFSGKSMITNVRIAKEQGFLHIPEGTEITERQMEKYPVDRVAVITTGSQGEPMSALTRIAQGRHKTVKIVKGDTIILSSRFIPGNERAITSVINSLYRKGANVVYEKVSDIHTSGHAKREELKLMLSLVHPRYFVPIHGEYRHLVKHAQLALEMGIPEDRVLVAENGAVIVFDHGQVRQEHPVFTGRVLVDGKAVGDVEELVLRDRRRLAGHGLVIILLAVDEKTGETLYGPEILSRGFVFEKREDQILEDARNIVMEILDELERPSPLASTEVETDMQRRLKRFFYKVTERNPLILPVIIPV